MIQAEVYSTAKVAVGPSVCLERLSFTLISNLQPGLYKIEIKVNDNLSKQTLDPTATFAVE